MAFGRDHLASRHRLAFEGISFPTCISVSEAFAYEESGNWFLAAEAFSRVEQNNALISVEDRARILVRIATCMEVASIPHSAARAYNDAARLLSDNQVRVQDAGELFNRAALQFREAKQFFFAGSAWRSAAAEFAKLGNKVISSIDNIGPMPMSAAGMTCAGIFSESAGTVFELATGNEMWSCMAYWEAGKYYSDAYPSPNIQAFNAFVAALVACVRYYGGLELDVLRQSLPFSEAERKQEVNALLILENAVFRCCHHHQPSSLTGDERNEAARLGANRYLATAFHKFSTELIEIGNAREAAVFRRREKECWKRVYLGERRFGKVALYSLWDITSGYGESLVRWMSVCAISIALFAFLYFGFDAIAPVTGKFDYLYFSVITFTSLGYGDIHPEGVFGKILASAEIMLGLVMFGVLLSFLGSRFQR